MPTLIFDDLYPAGLLEAREAELRRFWAGEGPRAVLSIHDGRFPYRQLEDDDLMVEHAVRQILASANLSPHYLPWFGPDFGTISTARPWGGEVITPEGGCIFIKPVIHEPDDAERMLPGDPAGGDVARAIRLTARVKERLGTDRIWSRLIDLQGPLSTAGLLWEQEDFFCSMVTDPDVVHRLLERITDHLIEMIRVMRAEMGPLCGASWPFIWLPDDLGIVFTEDLMPLLSPELYQEFGIPYMKRLADAFGGAFLHCCGAFEQHLPNLANSGANILGFDYAEPLTRTEALYEAFGSDRVYHIMLATGNEERFGGDVGFLEHLAKVAPADMRIFFALDSTWEGAAEREQAIRRHFLEE